MDLLDLVVAMERWDLLDLLDLPDLLDLLDLPAVELSSSASLFRRRPLIPCVVATTALMILMSCAIVTWRLTPPLRP